jgi:hypothetical protein
MTAAGASSRPTIIITLGRFINRPYGLVQNNCVLKNLNNLKRKNICFCRKINTMLILGMSRPDADIHSDRKNRVF